jgi:hypothetical protein
MDIKKCDIKTCQQTYPVDKGHSVVIDSKRYDFCESCQQKLKQWVNEFLGESGKTVTTFTINYQWPITSVLDHGNETSTNYEHPP